VAKKNIGLSNIYKTLIVYFLFSHIVACIFVTIGFIEKDFNKSWFSKLPAPQLTFPNN